MFIGYSLTHKGYRCLDPLTNRVYISIHVYFDEDSFPFHSTTLLKLSPSIPTSNSSSFSLTFPHLYPTSKHHFSTQPFPASLPQSSSHSTTPESAINPPIDPSPASVSQPEPIPTPLPPSQLVTSTHPMQTRSKSGIFKPKAYTATKHPLPSHLHTEYVPSTYLQASKYPHWRVAMQDEFNALLNTGTWTLLPPLLKTLLDINGFLELRRNQMVLWTDIMPD